ncbi:hypothetical protein QR680_019177 [Steinernema hermaphroditum]|uniref:ELM2 domain-containing protein n=1 Tax=Steinernema hermaphroditum TaxID=289476 RepID=A0AA39HL74_9BILA|nr:hypothetical protein QR680_019177 [Steinernema hermaphroditum]
MVFQPLRRSSRVVFTTHLALKIDVEATANLQGGPFNVECQCISIGPEFQADIDDYNPNMVKPAKCADRDVSLWIPNGDQPKISRLYRERAIISGKDNEDVLYCLYLCDYNETTTSVVLRSGSAPSVHEPMKNFDKDDQRRFEEALIKCGTNFITMQRKHFPELKVAGLVDYYYTWKYSPKHTAFNQRIKEAIAHNELRQRKSN